MKDTQHHFERGKYQSLCHKEHRQPHISYRGSSWQPGMNHSFEDADTIRDWHFDTTTEDTECSATLAC